MKSDNHPLSRKHDIVIQEFHNEVLIYDLAKNKAYCLNETSSMVWRECNGINSVTEISRKLSITLKSNVNEDIVWLALKQFKKDNLLENDKFVNPLDGLNRREIVKRIGFASMVALPLIASVIAPTAIRAASGSPNTCDGSLGPGTSSFLVGSPCAGSNSDCCSGACVTNPDSSTTCAVGMFANPAAAVCCPNFVCDCASRGGVSARLIGCPCFGNTDCCSGSCNTNPDSSMTCNLGMFTNPSAAPCCA